MQSTRRSRIIIMKSLLQLVFHVLSLEKPARTVGIDVICIQS